MIASMNTAAYTGSRGLAHHAVISSMTRSVIRVTVSLETSAPYTSAKCAEISPVVKPLADSDSTTASRSDRRRARFGTMTGSNVPSRSRGTPISTAPALSVTIVLVRFPLRELPRLRPSGAPLS
jgi:hypothetical protein